MFVCLFVCPRLVHHSHQCVFICLSVCVFPSPRSEGFLLLPSHIPHTELLTRLFRGQLRVRKRQRIRVTLGSHDQPLGSHDQPLGSCDQPLGSHDQPLGSHDQPLGSHDQPLGSRDQPLGSHELPVRALNEVFIGEKDHSQ